MKWSLSAGLPVWVCILIGVIVGIASGAVLGAANGVMVAYLSMQPMIATLAMMLVAWGLAMVLSSTSAIPLTEFGTFLKLGQGRTLGLTNTMYLILIAALAAAFLLNRTLIGRYRAGDGVNEEGHAPVWCQRPRAGSSASICWQVPLLVLPVSSWPHAWLPASPTLVNPTKCTLSQLPFLAVPPSWW